jgi:hypothetical protein
MGGSLGGLEVEVEEMGEGVKEEGSPDDDGGMPRASSARAPPQLALAGVL